MYGIRVLIGHVEITREDVEERETFECAAWSRDHVIQPGTYPVYATFDVLNPATKAVSAYWVQVRYDSIIRDEDFTPLFAGVAIGVTRKDGVGKRSTVARQTYAYQFPAELADNGPGPVEWLGGTFTPLPGMRFEPALSVRDGRRYGTHIVTPGPDAQWERSGGREHNHAYIPYAETPWFLRTDEEEGK